jgi:DNA-binding MarR family transcriptional regulator
MDRSDALYDKLTKIDMLLSHGDRLIWQQFSLSEVRYYTLVHLSENPGISLSGLAERLLCTKGNATRVIQGMESDGLVLRQVDENDSRALQLFLTNAGEALLEKASEALSAYNHQRFACLTFESQASFQQNLETLRTHLTALLETD